MCNLHQCLQPPGCRAPACALSLQNEWQRGLFLLNGLRWHQGLGWFQTPIEILLDLPFMFQDQMCFTLTKCKLSIQNSRRLSSIAWLLYSFPSLAQASNKSIVSAHAYQSQPLGGRGKTLILTLPLLKPQIQLILVVPFRLIFISGNSILLLGLDIQDGTSIKSYQILLAELSGFLSSQPADCLSPILQGILAAKWGNSPHIFVGHSQDPSWSSHPSDLGYSAAVFCRCPVLAWAALLPLLLWWADADDYGYRHDLVFAWTSP